MKNNPVKKIYFFLDDSGVLDFPQNSNYFCYCGYMIIGNKAKGELIANYRNISNEIKIKYDVPEVKGCIFDKFHNHKDLIEQIRLYKVMLRDKCYVLLGNVINGKLKSKDVFTNKHSKVRYKNYVLKLLVKEGISRALKDNLINKSDNIEVTILIDEEQRSTNGIYNLKESISSEIFDGTSNFQYNRFYPPILDKNKNSGIHLTYCDSKTCIPVQMADIVSNLFLFFLQNDYNINYFRKRNNTIYKEFP